ncbi:hypothetical protein Tco_0656280 [Tanacetum coccineum]|uniref:Uncharacterized protein n=1 Tax=Tanacetum coccineum TaxID=301880 RepID=A0ABQ4X8C8_9ASTR
MALPPRHQRHQCLRYEGLQYTEADIADFESRLARIYRRELSGARRCLSWRQFILALGLHIDEEMQAASFGAYQAESARQIPDKGDLKDYWIRISSARDFLGTTPSYTVIRDPIRMDVDSVNVPYLLARYLRLFAARRKNGVHISGGEFVARLAEHFGLLTAEIL